MLKCINSAIMVTYHTGMGCPFHVKFRVGVNIFKHRQQQGYDNNLIFSSKTTITINHTSPVFWVSALWEKGIVACNEKFLLFPVFSNLLQNFPPFSSNVKLLSANSFSLGASNIFCLGNG